MISIRSIRAMLSVKLAVPASATVNKFRRFYCKDSFSAAQTHLKEVDTVNIGGNAEDCRTLDPSA
jgi:hypothetical protein